MSDELKELGWRVDSAVERISALESENNGLQARVYALEHALSDLLVACHNGDPNAGQSINAPSSASINRMMHRHYNILVGQLDAGLKREHIRYPVE